MTHIPPDVRALLVCPRCRGPLTDAPEALCCDACRLRYRVDRDIPVLLVDEATPLDAPNRSSR